MEEVEEEEEVQSCAKSMASAAGEAAPESSQDPHKRQIFHYKEEEPQEYLSKAFASILFFPANVAIQKV